MVDRLSAFDQYFEIVQALTAEQVTQGQRLRFQVFSLERQLFSQEQCPEGIEFDVFDSRSVHSHLQHRTTNQLAATVRLVLSNPLFPEEEFPLEKRLQFPLYYEAIDVRSLPRSFIAEISRFAISKQFRHRAGDDGFEESQIDRRASAAATPNQFTSNRRAEGRRSFPHISLGLFKAIVQMSAVNNVQYWYAAMEPSLIRLLSRFGIHFHLLGPLIDYLGKRQPCIASVEELLGRMATERPDVWAFITDNGHLLGGSYFPRPMTGEADMLQR